MPQGERGYRQMKLSGFRNEQRNHPRPATPGSLKLIESSLSFVFMYLMIDNYLSIIVYYLLINNNYGNLLFR